MASNAGLHTASMLNLHMNMSMAVDCLLLASWLGAFSVVIYTTMVRCILQSVTWRHDSNSRRTTRNKMAAFHHVVEYNAHARFPQ